MFDEDQQQAFNLPISGHNLLISGQAGTGKTHLLKHIITNQRQVQRRVSVVCSTGLAATLYGSLGGNASQMGWD